MSDRIDEFFRPQKTSFKIYEGDTGETFNYEYFSDYPTEDELELMRWFGEGGR